MDQVEAKVAESAAEKQVPNRFQTGYPPQEAARQLEEIVKGWDKQPRPVQLLKALCRLVADSDSGGVDGFSALELVDAVQKSGVTDWGGDADPDRFRKLVNRNWNDLQTLWAERRPGIIERFTDSGLNLVPELDRKEGEGAGIRPGTGSSFRLRMMSPATLAKDWHTFRRAASATTPKRSPRRSGSAGSRNAAFC